MEFRDKNILLISPESWDHIFLSKHHYAIELAKRGNKVFFLNPPTQNWRIEETAYENLFSVEYNGFLKGLRFLPAYLQRVFMKQVFSRLESICKVKFDVVWSFDNSVFFDFKFLPHKALSISHIVDPNQNFEFERAAKTACLNLSNTTAVLKRQKRVNPNSFFINHGYYQAEHQNRMFSLESRREVNVGYAGNLDIPYIDWGIFESLIKGFPQIQFHFAGPLKNLDRISWLENASNVSYYGKLNKEELYSFYEAMNLFVIIYKADDYPDQLSNSHKVLEYLGAGKPIISTFMQDCTKLKTLGFLAMSNSNREYLQTFESVINNIKEWCTKELTDKRKEFAYENSYGCQLKKIEEIITANVLLPFSNLDKLN